MAFFGKKNKGVNVEAPDTAQVADMDVSEVSEVSQEAAPKRGKKDKKGKKKERDLMGAVINETVVESVIENGYAGNDYLKYEDKYIGLFLQVERIGGLNARVAAKDEAKAQIIEQINSGHIKALVTPDLIEAEAVVIVPDPISLDTMSEYTLLTSLSYPVALIDDSGDVVVKQDVEIAYDDAVSCIEDGGSFAMFLGGEAIPATASNEAQSGQDDVDASFDGADEPADDGDAPFEDEMPFDSGSVPDDAPVYDDSAENWSGETDNSGFEEDPLVFDDEQVSEDDDEEEEEIAQDAFDRAITRKLYSDDLGLEISTEAFDMQFMHGNPFVPFVEDRGDGWLNQYLSQMSRDANVDMRRTHQDNIMKMRTLFLSILSEYVGDICKELDYTDKKTDYGQVYDAVMAAKADAEDNIDNMISDRRGEIADEWERKLAEVGNAASIAATSQYRDRHEKQHNDAMQRVEQELRNKVLDDFNDNVRDMNDKRREEAAKRLDLGITSALSEVSRMYAPLLEAEQKKYEEYQKQMSEFIDKNRKDEVARIAVLDEDNKQREKADIVMAECTAKLQQQTEEFEARRVSLSNELESLKRQHAEELKAREKEYVDGLRKAREEHETLEGRVDQLTGELIKLDDKKESQYQARMDALIAERESFAQKYEHLVDMVKKERMMVVTFAAVGVMAALVVGFVVGEFVNIKGKSLEVQKRISSQMEEDMQNVEFNLPDGYEGNVSEDGTVTITRTGLDGEESLPVTISE